MSVVESKMSVTVGSWADVVRKVEAHAAPKRAIAVSVSGTPREEEVFLAFLKNVERALPEMSRLKGEESRQRWLNVLLDEAFDQVGEPVELQIEAKMLASAQARVLQSMQFVPAARISELMGSSAANPSSLPNRLKGRQKLFAIQHGDKDLFPLYALDKTNSFRPYPVVAEILAVLKGWHGWALANWFESPNGYLGNKKPREVIGEQPEEVLKAAKTEAGGIEHG